LNKKDDELALIINGVKGNNEFGEIQGPMKRGGKASTPECGAINPNAMSRIKGGAKTRYQ